MSPTPPVVILSLEPAEIPVIQEELASCAVRVANNGPEPRQLTLRLTGEAAAWSWVTPGILTVAAGGEGVVKAVFRPPSATLPAAGPLAFGVEVAAGAPGEPRASVQGTLEVAAFSDVFANIEPATSTGTRSGQHTLVLENRGNAAVRAEVQGSGDDGVEVDVEPATVAVGSGGRAEVAITVRGVASFRRGAPRAHALQVVASPEGARPVSIGATFSQQASQPAWAAKAAVAGVVALGITGLAGATLLGSSERSGGGDDLAPGATADDVTAGDPACPADGHIGDALHGSASTGPPAPGYTFLFAYDEGCQPVRFNPCEPVSYVINDALAPPGAVADVEEAIARLAEATGLTFVDAGRTDEPLDQRRSAYQPERYGMRWAPILIGWSKLGAGQGPDAAGDDIIVAGQGNPMRVGDVLVSGVLELNADVILNRDTRERLPGGFGEGITRGRVILHELGHVLGLGHPASPAQLMYAELADHTSSTAQFGVGDRIGLRLLGREAGCLTPPPLPSGS